MSKDNTHSSERHQERQLAFELLFEQIFRQDSIESIIEDASAARDAEAGKYTRKLSFGVEEHLSEIDEMIEKHLKGWKMNRVSKVALTIMRISVYEMLYEKSVPVSVSINEAVELAKEFATKDDASFVNGVLGSAARTISESGGEK